MNKQKFSKFIGIDVSKNTFDVAIISENTTESFVFENSLKGTKAFFQLIKNKKYPIEQCFICMEHTGIYGQLIISKCVEKQVSLCVEMSLKIMRSWGLQRGKNDKVDAIRIADYARKNHSELELYKITDPVLEKIKILMNARDKMVRTKADMMKYPNELKRFAPELFKTAETSFKKTINTLTKEIQRLELEIEQLIIENQTLKSSLALITTIPGIGKITALYLCIHTNFFTRYENAKQLACYCGVVPFEHSSGTSVKKRAKVHHMANRVLKKQLHMCALAAVTHDPELKNYYQRKVGEGKSKMLVLNNVRNKLVHRVCAVIKRQKPYMKNVA